MGASNDSGTACPFIDHYVSEVLPRWIEPHIRHDSDALGLGALERVTGINRRCSRCWFGFAGRDPVLPHYYQVHKIACGFSLDEDATDELWGAYLCAMRQRCEDGTTHRAQIGLRAGEVRR